MRYACLFFTMLVFACGKSDKKETKKDQPTINAVPKTYEWSRPISDLSGKRVDLYGFVWLDTILPVIKQGSYTVYERPNCYQCRTVPIKVSQDLVIIDIIDTTRVPDSAAQWRLVKLTGIVENDQVNLEKLERSVHSYPDYESSGYQMITDSLLEAKIYNDTHVYLDGVILFKGKSFNEGYTLFSIISVNIKKYISIYIKNGNGPNQVDDKMNNIVKDMDGYGLRSVKIRLYGSWKNFQKPEEMKEEGMIFVEAIKRL